MLSSERGAVLAELGGAHWGLLPALASLPWLISLGGETAGIRGCFLLLACLMASFDLVTRRIPNPLAALAALSGLAAAWASGGWSSLAQAGLAGLVAFSLMLVFHLMGAVGAGDVKALGALGCFTLPWGAVQLFLYTALAGGLLAGAYLLLGRRRHTLPYGVAIAAGALALAAGGGLP